MGEISGLRRAARSLSLAVLPRADRIPSARLYARLYLLFGSIAVLLLSVIVPPYQAPDEINHFKRADHVSRGGVVGHRVGSTSGGMVSQGIDASAVEYAAIAFHPDVKATPEMNARAASITWANSEVAPASFPNTALYPPFLYLSGAAVILLGKAMNLGVVTTLTLSRAIGGVIAVGIGGFAISIAGGLAPFIFALLLLPMSLFLMASVSQDGVLIALAALSVAIFTGMRERQAASMPFFVAMCVCITFVAMARPPYAALAVLPLLAFGQSWTKRLVAVAAVLASVALWATLVSPIAHLSAHPGANPPQQVAAMLAEPLTTLWIFGRSLNAGLLDSFVGRLGWLETRLPITYIVLACAALLIGAIATAASLREAPSRSESALIAAAMLAGLLLLFAVLYVMWTAPGMRLVAGVQGRYLIPFALLGAAAIQPLRMPRIASYIAHYAMIWLGLFAPLTLVVMIVTLWQRYYFPS